MQIYVITNAISATNDTPVAVTYDDTVVVAQGTYPNATRFWFAGSEHLSMSGVGSMFLMPSWRDDLVDVINGESERRIFAVFPDYTQRNATAISQTYMLNYGNDVVQWPVDAQNQQKEIDRGWAYVNNIRAATNALIATGPLNPCDDNLWPSPIPPIHLQPVS
jgi:hypothetical protein